MQPSRGSAPAPHPDKKCDRCGASLLAGEIVVRTHRGMWLLMGLGGLAVYAGFALDLWLRSLFGAWYAALMQSIGSGPGTLLGCLAGTSLVIWGTRLGKVREERCRACGATTLRRVGRAGDGPKRERKAAP